MPRSTGCPPIGRLAFRPAWGCDDHRRGPSRTVMGVRAVKRSFVCEEGWRAAVASRGSCVVLPFIVVAVLAQRRPARGAPRSPTPASSRNWRRAPGGAAARIACGPCPTWCPSRRSAPRPGDSGSRRADAHGRQRRDDGVARRPDDAQARAAPAVGSFKPRGVANKPFALSPAERGAGVVAVSGGNHGIAVARWRAGWTSGRRL